MVVQNLRFADGLPDRQRRSLYVLRNHGHAVGRASWIDQGIPYDPLAKEDPDVTLSAEERQIGGLGIYMVKKSMDAVTYEYKDGQNILSIKKNLG